MAIGLSTAASYAAEPAKDRDKEVRDELIGFVLNRQEEDFREKYTIEIPDVATGLPAKYDLLFHGQHVGIALLRVEVKVRGEKATMEIVTAGGIRRGVVPLEPIDRLARQLVYSRIATTERLPMESSRRGRRMSASHASNCSYFIKSRTRGNNLYVYTEPNQLLARSIDEATRGLSGLIETEGEALFWKLEKEHLRQVGPDDESRADLIRRLKALHTPADDFPDYQLRKDLAAVEALLYGALAVEWRVADALPELKRLALRNHAAMLEILTTDDPTEPLKAALLSGDLLRWSLQFAVNEKSGKHVDLVVDAVALQSPYVVGTTFKALKDAKLSPDQIRRLEEYHAKAGIPEARVASATFLMNRQRGDSYYDELHGLALRKRDVPKYSDPEEYARDAIFAYSIDSGKRRDESAAVARKLLQAIPENARSDTTGLTSCLRALGKLGGRKDVALLSRYCQEQDWYIANIVIDAVTEIDPPSSSPLVRRRIAFYLADNRPHDRNYGSNVGKHLDFLVWRRDIESQNYLAAAIAKHRDTEPDNERWGARSDLTLKYLLASTLDERVAAAREYVAAGGLSDKKWRVEVGKQLVLEGAAPDAVAALLESADDPPAKPR